MKKIITCLNGLGFWCFVVIFTVSAIVFSEALMAVHSYLLIGNFFDRNLFIVGFTVPAIVGAVFSALIYSLIRNLKYLQDEKEKTIILQKETQEKLHIQKELAHQYLDITGTMIIALCLDGNISLANKEMCKALGYYSEEELIGKNWFELYAPASISKVIFGVFQEILDGNIEDYKKYENELLFSDAKTRIVEWNNEYIRDNNGDIVGVLSSGRDITESREAEEKLKRSENYQRAILDSFPFFIWLKDTNSNYLATNRAVADAVGLNDPSEIIGKNDLDIFPEDMANSFRADDKEVMKSLQKKEFEELIEGNGERRWHETYKAPILDKDGNLFGTVGFARDITKDKESEEELKLMKYALDNAEEGVFLTDKNGCFKYVSDGSVRQLGYSKEELKKMGIPDIDPDFMRSSLPAFFAELQHNGSLTISTMHKNKDETIFPVEINANHIEYRGNEYALAFVRDITKRKQIEDKLKLLASVFTHTHEGIVITNSDNNIIDVNSAFVEITGYSLSEVVGKNPSILQSGRNDDNFYIKLWTDLKKYGVWKGELWNKNKNGEEYAEDLTISAVYDDNKKVQNYVAIFKDITLQMQQQEKLEHNAHYDMLTNLPNRILFSDRIHQAMAQATRRKQPIAVAFIDLDGFKNVNDNYGHEIGDKLLILLSEKMTKLLREGDTIARIGGDEFMVLLVDAPDKIAVTSFLSRLLEIVSESIFIDEFPIDISASIGVTFYPQQEELSTEQIIKQADEAMYQAKESGKNRYCFFNSEDSTQQYI